MPEAMPFVLCSVCLVVVLVSCEKARGIYDQIVQSYRLPDIQAAFRELEGELPPRRALWEDLAGDLGMKRSRGNDERKPSLPDRESPKRLTERASRYLHVFAKWFDVETDKILSADFRYWHGLIDELIRVGFNNESEQARGIYRVTAATSSTLCAAILIRSLAEYNNVEVVDWEEMKGIRVAGRTHDLTKWVSARPTTRRYRRLTRAYKEAGYRRHQDEKIAQIALYWYFSRVVYSGPQEFCNEVLKNGIVLEPSNVSNEIRECDSAIGYARGK